MRSVARVVLGGLVMAGCGGSAPVVVPPAKAGLRLTTPEEARRVPRTMHVDLPFQLADTGVNGTALLIGFLQRMEGYGGLYVSDLSFALQLRRNGAAIECVSKIVVDDGRPHPAAAQAPAPVDEADYTTTVKPWTPPATTASVVDRDMVCTQHAQQVAAEEPQYENRYDVGIGPYMAPGAMPVETTKIVHYDECTFEPAQRIVHRYEHFLAARFSPPDIVALEHQYADGRLIAEPPLCHTITAGTGTPLRQHITADVHFGGDVQPAVENEIRLTTELRITQGY